MGKKGLSLVVIIAILFTGSQLWLRGWGFRLLKNVEWLYGDLSGTGIQTDSRNCDSNLWKYVYSPERLYIINPCAQIRGTVSSVFANSDGDYHIGIKLYNKDIKIVNFFNMLAWKGSLVTEVICAHANKENDCQGYQNKVLIPKPGDKVLITGSYVVDTTYGWNEIHPVSRIIRQ